MGNARTGGPHGVRHVPSPWAKPRTASGNGAGPVGVRLRHPQAAARPLGAAHGASAFGGSVAGWTHEQKIEAALRRSLRYMPAAVAHEIEALLTPENLAITVGTVTLWAGSHICGVGEVVDVGLLLAGAVMIGWSIEDVAKSLLSFALTAWEAHSDADIDRAAQAFAHAVITGGITVVMALLLKRNAASIEADAARGGSVSNAARIRRRGFVEVGEDEQSWNPWRKHEVVGDANMPAGEGATSPFGDATVSTAGSATEQQLARIHEAVHQFLTPRLGPLRRIRVQVRMSGYWRSVILRYLEEAMAETYAQLRVNGLSGLVKGIRFPVDSGCYNVTPAGIAAEGRAIGTIVVGVQRFVVTVVVGPPPLAKPKGK